jgi:hypothetical protein
MPEETRWKLTNARAEIMHALYPTLYEAPQAVEVANA